MLKKNSNTTRMSLTWLALSALLAGCGKSSNNADQPSTLPQNQGTACGPNYRPNFWNQNLGQPISFESLAAGTYNLVTSESYFYSSTGVAHFGINGVGSVPQNYCNTRFPRRPGTPNPGARPLISIQAPYWFSVQNFRGRFDRGFAQMNSYSIRPMTDQWGITVNTGRSVTCSAGRAESCFAPGELTSSRAQVRTEFFAVSADQFEARTTITDGDEVRAVTSRYKRN
jgi:hypothetical protein